MNKFYAHKSTYLKQAIAQRHLRNAILKQTHNALNVVEIGANQAELAKAYAKAHNFKRYLAIDINPMHKYFAKPFEFRQLDAHNVANLALNFEFDLLLSNACFQWLDLIKCFKDIAALIKPGGRMIFSSFIAGNLEQISQVFNHQLEYLNKDQLCAIVQNECKILSAQTKVYKLRFDSPLSLLAHLKYSGVGLNKAHFIKRSELAALSLVHHNTLTYKALIINARKL